MNYIGLDLVTLTCSVIYLLVTVNVYSRHTLARKMLQDVPNVVGGRVHSDCARNLASCRQAFKPTIKSKMYTKTKTNTIYKDISSFLLNSRFSICHLHKVIIK